MKNFIKYLKSPKSDTLLFLILLVLVNLVCSKAFFRIDLTEPKSYSLSKASGQVVKTLEEPLSVKVFFSSNLPAPYSNVYQYLKDILVEYKGSANRNFSYEFFDMNKPENENIARNYNLRQIQIQELKNNEVGFKQVWMGLVFTYADGIEILDGISSTDGLEYRISTTISKMVSTTSALAGLNGKAKLTLYVTDKLKSFRIQGFDQMEGEIRKAYNAVNKKNMDRIEFQRIDPNSADIQDISQKYGLQVLNWNDPNNGTGSGILGLVLEYGDKFNVIPLKMVRSFFGNAISGLENLEESITESLQSIVSKSQEIGYITGHGELDFNDEENGSARLTKLISDRYTFKGINLAEEEIPSSLSSIVIDGPVKEFSDSELYKIDQFVLKGGNIIVFADAFEEHLPQGQMAYYQQPSYTPINSGIEKILDNYGVKLEKNYVFDEECYFQNDQRFGKVPFYFAPLVQKNLLAQKSAITKNLGFVIFLQSGAIDIEKAKADKDVKTTVLVKSSPKSWKVEKNITTNPMMISVPSDKSSMRSENLAVLLEGKFHSAFDEAPKAESKDAAEKTSENELSSKEHLSKSVQNGKILVISSSKLTGPQILDADGGQPVALFVRNAIDYMNGEEELCTMRTKGLSLNTLTIKNAKAMTVAKYFNEVGIVILVALAGILVLLKIRAKKIAIRKQYNPDDSRVIEK